MTSVVVSTTSCEKKNNLNKKNNSQSPIRRDSSRSSNRSLNKAHLSGKLPTIQLSPAENQCFCYQTNGFSCNDSTNVSSHRAYYSESPSQSERTGSSLREMSLPSSPFVPSLSSMSPTPQFLTNNYNTSSGRIRFGNNTLYNLPNIPPIDNKYTISEPNNNNVKTSNEKAPFNSEQPVCCYCSQCNPVSPKFPFCAACAASAGKLKRTTYKSASIAVPTLTPIMSENRLSLIPPPMRSNLRSSSSIPASPLPRINPKHHHLIFEPSSSHGCFRKSVPSMPMIIAIFCCLLNFCLPGTGTLVASMSVLFGCNTEYGKPRKMRAFLLGVLIAIIQMSTAIFVLGWVWSIMWGINFIKHSSMESEESLYPDHRESFEISSNSTSIYSNNIGYIKEVNSV